MAVKITFEDNSGLIKSKLAGNVRAAVTAMGIKAVGLTVQKMQSGYHDPHPTRSRHGEIIGEHTAIRDTGELMRDVNFEVDAPNHRVTVGNSLEYAPYVHEGTCKLKGRPYLRDAIMEGIETKEFKQVAQRELRKGFTESTEP